VTPFSYSLSELEAAFVAMVDRSFHVVDRLADAHGVMFLCPRCFHENGGSVGTESFLCWFADRGVPPDMTPGPGRWRPSGSGLADLTFVGPDACSIASDNGKHWHGFIRNGRVEVDSCPP
jgi:hypothetical protein